MKRILAPILLLTLLFPALAFGETMKNLLERDGLHYKKFSDVPFTGKITGSDQGSFKDGRRDGLWVGYRPDKSLMYKQNLKNGILNGPSIYFYENGQLGYKGTFKNGEFDGPFVSYHEGGGVAHKGTYKDGKRDGPWVFYNKDGTKRFTPNVRRSDEGSGTYKDGVKVK